MISSRRLSTATLLLLQCLAMQTTGARLVVEPRHCHGAVKHIHLAPGKDPSHEMTVSFATKWSNPGVEAPLGGVFLGRSPNKLDRFVGESELPLVYNTSLPREEWGHYYSPFQHHITIDNLQPNTTYYYVAVEGSRSLGLESLKKRDIPGVSTALASPSSVEESREPIEGGVQMETKVATSKQHHGENLRQRRGRRLAPPPYDGHNNPCIDPFQVRSFRTAPASGPETPVSFAIIGDLGMFLHSQETLAHMWEHKNAYDAVVLVGDIAYTENDDRRWELFFDMLDDYSVFHEKPLAVTAGNHDIEKQEFGREIFRAYENRFRMPRVKPPELGLYQGPMGKLNMDAADYPLPYEWGNAYYAFTYGSARHVVVSAYSNMDEGSVQYEWLEEELQSIDRSKTPWVLLTMHVPIYKTFDLHNHDKQIFAARDYIEPLLAKYNVNVVFSGHIHAYQRTGNVIPGGISHPRGPIHITIGAGGRKCDAPFVNATAESWIEARDASMYGYGTFQIYNRTVAEWKWIPLSPSDDHDFNFVKNHKDEPLPSLDHDSVIILNQHFLTEV